MRFLKRNRKLFTNREDFVHVDVERFGGNLVDELEIEADADAFHIGVFAEETVVVTPSSTNAVAFAVEGYTGDDDEVEIASIRLVLGFKDVEVANGESGVFAKCHGNNVVAYHGGQDNGLLEVPFLQEGLGLHFVGQSAVEHNPFGFDEVGMSLQFGQYLFRLFEQLFFGMLLLQGFDEGA